MGSGLILLVIVAAWLAVLVPMALRTHESSTSLSSVDRFSDAMRVLSRRDAVARARARREADDDPLSAAAYADGSDDDWDEWDDDVERPGWRERLGGLRARVSSLTGRRSSGERRPKSPAVRRRRILFTLVVLTAGCFAGAALGGPRELLYAGGGLLVVVALFVLQLRRLAVQRAERARRNAPARPAQRRRPAPAPAARPAVPAARSGSVRVQQASVPEPEVVPARVADDQLFDASLLWEDAAPVADEPAVACAAVRHDEPVPAARTYAPPAAALGGAWSPVPVPPPTYVTAPVAPPRAPRIVDLTRPGAWSQAEARAAADRAAEELPGSAPKAEPAADRRRAVNDW